MLSALGKLVTSILNNGQYDYIVQKGILKAEEGGFRKMHGTVENILFYLFLFYYFATQNKFQLE